ncbi:protein MKS1-like [Zingiber officinale]|uniref:protein MKS1-like n=1 Tax=Zingiber officinale TaxID=94328 RepID=UPI001C4B1735|nr:protein MKS1-like [Zingiber officinale]
MDPSGFRPSPRQEIQLKGPRPSALSLKVSKDSHSIRKPAAAAAPSRDPVIIYSVSPKIIHAEPGEFMTLVQRLTGPGSATLPSPGACAGALSPAARIASFEKATPPASALVDLEPDCGPALGRLGAFPGILSPEPAALSPIPPHLFSPSLFSPESSPAFADDSPTNVGYNFLTSPSSNFLSTPTVPSPGTFWELLHQFPDLIEKSI